MPLTLKAWDMPANREAFNGQFLELGRHRKCPAVWTASRGRDAGVGKVQTRELPRHFGGAGDSNAALRREPPRRRLRVRGEPLPDYVVDFRVVHELEVMNATEDAPAMERNPSLWFF